MNPRPLKHHCKLYNAPVELTSLIWPVSGIGDDELSSSAESV